MSEANAWAGAVEEALKHGKQAAIFFSGLQFEQLPTEAIILRGQIQSARLGKAGGVSHSAPGASGDISV